MGLSMQFKEGKSIPVLTCDICGKLIEDWRLAMVAFPWPSEDSTIAVKVFHKVKCDPGSDKKDAKFSMEFSQYLPWLLWNHGWGTKGTSEKGATLTLDVPEPLDM